MEREMRIRNYSERTISSYLSSISKACMYFNLPPGKISTSQFKSYLLYLVNEKEASVSLINQCISAWKIVQQDILGRDWEPVRIKRPRPRRTLPDILSEQEARALINTPRNLKHRAIVNLLYATGIRRSELLAIRLTDIDGKRSLIKVQGKGQKQREVVVPDSLFSLLKQYYQAYRPLTYLFESSTPGKPYSPSSVASIVSTAANKAGIKKRVSPHVLRHCFATHMLERGVNLKRVQLLMGHNAMKTTSIYLHLANLDNTQLPDLTLVKS
jgi:site-specific recombinase XerD